MMGEGNSGVAKQSLRALQAISALSHSGTIQNHDSTRCVLQVQTTFGQTGKLSGVIFWLYLLEKNRVSSTDM